MKFHKEGHKIILFSLLLIDTAIFLSWFFIPWVWLNIILTVGLLVFLFLILYFFRVPNRNLPTDEDNIYSSADGKVVVIEKIQDTDLFNGECWQISVFMSPLNVHINWLPISGLVKKYRYDKGKFLVAWHPKSSELNERSNTLIEGKKGNIVVKQIAGAVARRIVCYSKEGEQAKQNEQLGFIKFGSRIDLLLPANVDINVKIGDVVTGGQTIIAKWK